MQQQFLAAQALANEGQPAKAHAALAEFLAQLPSGQQEVQAEAWLLSAQCSLAMYDNSRAEDELFHARTLFTSLGNVVQNGREALQACVDYLRELSREAKELRAEGLGTGAIRERLLGEESELAGPTDGQFSGENLISAVLAADI